MSCVKETDSRRRRIYARLKHLPRRSRSLLAPSNYGPRRKSEIRPLRGVPAGPVITMTVLCFFQIPGIDLTGSASQRAEDGSGRSAYQARPLTPQPRHPESGWPRGIPQRRPFGTSVRPAIGPAEVRFPPRSSARGCTGRPRRLHRQQPDTTSPPPLRLEARRRRPDTLLRGSCALGRPWSAARRAQLTASVAS